MPDPHQSLRDVIARIRGQISDQDIDSEGLEPQIKKLKAKRYESDTADRKWLAEWATTVVTLWLASVLAIIVFNESKIFLSDSVLIALIGTTTLNVLGLTFIVLRGHFSSKE